MRAGLIGNYVAYAAAGQAPSQCITDGHAATDACGIRSASAPSCAQRPPKQSPHRAGPPEARPRKDPKGRRQCKKAVTVTVMTKVTAAWTPTVRKACLGHALARRGAKTPLSHVPLENTPLR